MDTKRALVGLLGLLICHGLACCAASGGRDAGTGELKDLPSDGAVDSLAAEIVVDSKREEQSTDSLDSAVAPDLPSSPTPYRLSSASVPENYIVHYIHNYLGTLPYQSRLNAIPFALLLRPDGRSVRVGVAWFNGYGAVISTYEPSWVRADPVQCIGVVDGLLPSGLVYYDIDITTDTVSFVGEVVLTPFSAEAMRRNWSMAIELFGGSPQVGDASSCTSTLAAPGMCLKIQGKEYLFPMCRHTADKENGYVPCVGYAWGCGRGCNEREPGTTSFDFDEVGFVDPVGKELHSLVVRNPVTGNDRVIPLPLEGGQISKEQALRSACVEGTENLGQPPYVCGRDTPYYLLYKMAPEDLLAEGCSCGPDTVGFESVDAYLENPSICKIPGSKGNLAIETAYFDPFVGEKGRFIHIDVADLIVWDGADQGNTSEWVPAFSKSANWHSWVPSGSWYFYAGGSADGTPFELIKGENRRIRGESGLLELGPPCYYWATSLVEGSKATSGFKAEVVGGQRVLRFMTVWESTMTLAELLAAYELDYPINEKPACTATYYRSVPLYDYPY